jgi:RHS repeat-associated protein
MKYEGGTEVYFDDLKIELSAVPVAMVVQENHYYPFGLGMKGLDYTAPSPNVENKFTFNGQTEKETKLNLNWHETAFRSYDPQLGRFHQIDPLADLFTGINPYQFGYNNPIRFNDPLGLAAQDSAAAPTPPGPDPNQEREEKKKAQKQQQWQDFLNQTAINNMWGELNGDDNGQNGFTNPQNILERAWNDFSGRGYLNIAHDFYANRKGDIIARSFLGSKAHIIFIEEGEIRIISFGNDFGTEAVKNVFDMLIIIVQSEFQIGGSDSGDNIKQANIFRARGYATAFYKAFPQFSRFIGTGLMQIHHRIPQDYRRLFGNQAIDNLSNLSAIPTWLHQQQVTPLWEAFKKAFPNPTQGQVQRYAKLIDSIIEPWVNNINAIIKQN